MLEAQVFDDRSLAKMPLPLAQLFRRALNAKTPLEQHLAAGRVAELGLKLFACGAIAEYLALQQHDPTLHECLKNLARPSLGHWWEFSRRLVPVLADAGHPGYATLKQILLGRARDDFPRAAGLDAALREVLGLGSGARTTTRFSELFDHLIQHRNKAHAHAAPEMRNEDYHRRLATALLSGLGEVFDRLDVLAGSKLIYVSDVRQVSGGWQVQQYDLVGEHSRRLAPWEAPREAVDRLPDAEQIYLQSLGSPETALRRLSPLALYEPETEEFLLFNARGGRREVEYLCYTSGRVERQPTILRGQQAQLLSQLLNFEVSPDQIEALAPSGEGENPPPEEPAATQRLLGEFELLSELGRGGMGVVYRAWQPSLSRQVALKKLVRTGDKSEQRFAREIRALGRVEHPHLVKIYTSGSDGDQWFYAMELVEGAPLSTVCEQLQRATTIDEVNRTTWHEAVSTAYQRARDEEKSLSPLSSESGTATSLPARPAPAAEIPETPSRLRPGKQYVAQVVELVRQAAFAAHTLHEAGIVHRDIKPGNIMVTADGRQAVLMDLGLAQLADDADGRLTRTRQFIGTLRYASPQQVLAAERLDRSSDVYSLGATLWELLTLRPLFDANEQTPTPTLMEKILHEDPVPMRRYNPHVSRDLDAIVAHCLEKKPERRYPTARELAADLGRYLQAEPVSVRDVSRMERLARWVARRRALAAAWGLSALVILLAGGGGVAFWLWQRAEQNLDIELHGFETKDQTPELHEVYPDVDEFVSDKKLIATKPPGWRELAEGDFSCVNATGEKGLKLLMCNLSNQFGITVPEDAEPSPFPKQGGVWRSVPLADSATGSPPRITPYTGLGWYAFFVRNARNEICPLYTRNPQGEVEPLGETNILTSRRVVLTITTSPIGGKRRYFASLAREP